MQEPKLEDFGLTKEDYNHYKYMQNRSEPTSMFGFGFKLWAGTLFVLWMVALVTSIINSDSIQSAVYIIIIFVIGFIFLGTGYIFFGGFIVQGIFDFVGKLLLKAGLLKDKEAIPDQNIKFKKIKEYEKQVEIYEAYLAEQLRKKKDFWYGLSGKEFEKELAKLYEKLGYKARLTAHTNDGGIDIILENSTEKIIVQCKAHKKKLGPSTVRELYGALKNSKAQKAILATLEGISSNAIGFIANKPITILTVKDILKMQEQLDDNQRV